jgi:hypothetical protein
MARPDLRQGDEVCAGAKASRDFSNCKSRILRWLKDLSAQERKEGPIERMQAARTQAFRRRPSDPPVSAATWVTRATRPSYHFQYG